MFFVFRLHIKNSLPEWRPPRLLYKWWLKNKSKHKNKKKTYSFKLWIRVFVGTFAFCILKVLLDYLTKEGFTKEVHELIERLMPNMALNKNNSTVNTNDTEVTNQSRNLFKSDQSRTFKQLSLYPRVFLLLQESWYFLFFSLYLNILIF